MKNDSWLDRATRYRSGIHERSQRRKSPWNLLLAFFVLVGWASCWGAFALLSSQLYSHFRGPHHFGQTSTNAAGIFLYVPILFPSMTLGMVLANFLIWCVPPARNALAKEDARIGLTYSKAQKELLVISLPLVFIAGIFISIGVVEPFAK
jgi:hypothetical protein